MENQTKYCKKCGTAYTIGEKFCGNCGEKTDPYNETIGVFSLEERVYTKPAEETQITPKKKNTGLIIGIVIAVVLALATIGMIAEKSAQKAGYGSDEVSSTDIETENIAVEKDEPKEVAFEIGTVSNGTYENKYLGLKCDLPSWTYLDRDELMEATQFSSSYVTDTFDDEKFLEELEKADVFCDMKATHPNGYTNINVMVQNTLAEDYGILNEKATMHAMASQMSDYYKDAGITLDSCEVMELDVNGTTKYPMYSVYSNSGIKVHTLQFIHMKPEHSSTLTVVGISKEECLTICESICFN